MKLAAMGKLVATVTLSVIFGASIAQAHDEIVSLDCVYKDGEYNSVFELDIDLANKVAEIIAPRIPNTTEEEREPREPDGYIPVIVSPRSITINSPQVTMVVSRVTLTYTTTIHGQNGTGVTAADGQCELVDRQIIAKF